MVRSGTVERLWPDVLVGGAISVQPAVLANQVRRASNLDNLAPASLQAILRAGRFDVRTGDLSSELGGREALLLPALGDRFDIVVDATPQGGWHAPARLRGATQAARSRFRIAHEIGHSFFYQRELPRPTRHSLPGSEEEENFCDQFAQELLLPYQVVTTQPPDARAVFELAASYGVSVEVATRALASCLGEGREVYLLCWPRGAAAFRLEEAVMQWASVSRSRNDPALIVSAVSHCANSRETVSIALSESRRQVVILRLRP